MRRRIGLILLGLAIWGCNRPSEQECRSAIGNIENLYDYREADLEAQVRRCRATSQRERVLCTINAKTREELVACDPSAKDLAPPAPVPTPEASPSPEGQPAGAAEDTTAPPTEPAGAAAPTTPPPTTPPPGAAPSAPEKPAEGAP